MSTPTRGLRAFLLSYLHQHPGEEVFIKDIQVAAKEAGQDWTNKQVQTSFSNILADKTAGKGVVCVVRGNSWRYLPNGSEPGKRLFEELGQAKDGRVVIQDEAGNLFVATPL